MPDPEKIDWLSLVPNDPVPSDPRYGGAVQALDQAKFRFQLKSNADNQKLRAQDQGFWETLGIKAANLVPNVLTGIGEMVGYGGALFSEIGDDRDYSNALTEAMKSLKDPFGEVYRENPEEVWDPGDSAWWIDNLGGLAESAIEFAVPGGLLGKAFKGAALMAAGRLGRTGLQMAKGAAMTGTASTLAYMEGAMSGYQIYETAYNEQYYRGIVDGLPPSEAHKRAAKLASDAASTTVQMNTMMNTVLNLTALAPLFRGSADETLDFMRTVKKLPGETKDQFKARTLQLAEQRGLFKNRQGITSYLSESFQEGIEEVNTQYAEAEGRRVGEGKGRSISDALTDFGQYLKDVTNEEGALNFALGALGGVAQTAILDNIPLHRIEAPGTTGEDGKIKKTWVSSRNLRADGTRKYFERVQDAIADDFEVFDQNMKKLEKLAGKSDAASMEEAERIKMSMFDALTLNAVQMGAGQSWIETFEKIAEVSNDPGEEMQQLQAQLEQYDQAASELDPQTDKEALSNIQKEKVALMAKMADAQSEAVKKGLAANAQDNSYKDRARSAVEDIKAYQASYDRIYSRYNSEEEVQAGVPEFLFLQEANIYRQKKFLREGRTAVDQAKVENERQMALAGTTEDAFHRASAPYSDEVKAAQSTQARIQADLNRWNNAIAKKDEKTIDSLLRKYHMMGHAPSDVPAVMQKRMNMLYDAASKRMEKAMEKLGESIGFEEWKKEGKTLQDYVNFLGETWGTSAAILKQQQNLDELEQAIIEGERNLKELSDDSDGVKKLMRKIEPEIAKRNKAVIDRMRTEAEDQLKAQQAKDAHENLTKQHLEYERAQLADRILKLEDELESARESVRDLTEKVSQQKVGKSILAGLPLTKLWNLERALNSAESRAKSLETQLRKIRGEKEKLDEAIRTGVPPERSEGPVLGEPTAVTESPAVQPDPATETPVTQTPVDGTPPPEVQPAPVQSDDAKKLASAVAKYQGMLLTIPAPLQKAVTDLEQQAKAGADRIGAMGVYHMPGVKEAFPDFNEFQAQAGILQRTLTAMYEMVDLLPKVPADQQGTDQLVEEQEVQQPEPEEAPKRKRGRPKGSRNKPKPAPTPGAPAPVITEHVTTNPPEELYGVNTLGTYHQEKKTENGGDKIQNSTFETEDWTSEQGTYRITGVVGNQNVSLDVVTDRGLMPGAKVTLELDREFTGEVREPGAPNKRRTVGPADFFDEDGKVTNVGNVPIKILNEAGEIVGYVPTSDWMTDSYPGSVGREGLRNHVLHKYIPNGDGTMQIVDVFEREYSKLIAVRKAIVQMGKAETVIIEKGPGTPILNTVKKEGFGGRPIYTVELGKAVDLENPGNSLFPDYKNLQLGIVQSGVVQKGNRKSDPEDGMANDNLDMLENAPVIIMPAANGQKFAAPLYMPQLSDTVSLNTMKHVIELYLRAGDPAVDKEIRQLEKLTGHYVGTPQGLRDFIETQYTYTSSFTEANLAYNPNAPERFLFNITEPKAGRAAIMIGWENSGKPAIFANLEGGKLSGEFSAAFDQGISGRYKAVNFAKVDKPGINDSRKFTHAHWNGTEWKSHEYDGYNQFILALARTKARGNTKIGDTYIYAANPLIRYNSTALSQPLTIETDVALVPDPGQPGEERVEEEDEIESAVEDPSDLTGRILRGAKKSSYTPGATMQPLSLAMLRELATFTPPGNRNDRTPEDVYKELTSAGISYLAEGHNPFRKCQ